MSVVLTNNAESRLLSGISTAATNLTVNTGEGSLFPNPGPNEWFPLTLVKADGSAYEIVRATSRTGDTITIERAQENTTVAVLFSAGDIVSSRLTEAALRDLVSSISNLAADSTTGGANKYAVAIPSITSYEDNQVVSFIPHAASGAASTLQINGLGEIPIRKRTGTGGGSVTDVAANEIYVGQIANLHYESGLGVFILDNPVPAGVADASVSAKGIVQLAATPGVYNPTSGDNTRALTQLTGSQLVEEAIEASSLTPPLPLAWLNTGNGAGGDFTVSNGAFLTMQAGEEHQYDNLTIAAGGTVNTGGTRGVRVIRCTESFSCAGTIEGHRAGTNYPEHVMGPTGSARADGANTSNPRVQAKRGRAQNPAFVPDVLDNIVRYVSRRECEGAILQNFPMDRFTGGHGDADNTQLIPGTAGGGLIIIAPVINFQAGGRINNLHAEDSGMGSFQGPSGGGMIILVGQTITRNAGFLYECGVQGVANNEAYYVAQRSTNVEDVPGAGNGHLFTADSSTGAVARIF